MARRNLVVLVLVVVAVVAVAGSLVPSRGGDPDERLCTTEGVLGPNGEVFGRNPAHDCRFVDDDGNPLFPGA